MYVPWPDPELEVELYAKPGNALDLRLSCGLWASYSYHYSDEPERVSASSFFFPYSTCCKESFSNAGLCHSCKRVRPVQLQPSFKAGPELDSWLSLAYDPLTATILASDLQDLLVGKVVELYSLGSRWDFLVFDGKKIALTEPVTSH